MLEVFLRKEGLLPMKYYLEEVDSVNKELNTTENGLSTAEAEKRLAENGKNKLKEAEKDSIVKRFFDQMKDPMIVILLVAALVNAVTDMFSTGTFKFAVPTDTLIILFVVIVNAILGVVQ